MVNSVSKIPYKINKVLLDFVLEKGESFDMLIPSDFDSKFDYDSDNKLTKRELSQIKSMKSKYVLQNNIIDIANLFRNNIIYFPVILDQSCRLYCNTSYLKYQGSDLAKALLLFDGPGIIKRNDVSRDASFLMVFGANCFSSSLSRLSYNIIIAWVQDNSADIIDYENGKLLKKSKNKILFLSFCLQYVRYNNFINVESLSEFNTYLPIQLDATCNGFQHLTLLSDEKKIIQGIKFK